MNEYQDTCISIHLISLFLGGGFHDMVQISDMAIKVKDISAIPFHSNVKDRAFCQKGQGLSKLMEPCILNWQVNKCAVIVMSWCHLLLSLEWSLTWQFLRFCTATQGKDVIGDAWVIFLALVLHHLTYKKSTTCDPIHTNTMNVKSQ